MNRLLAAIGWQLSPPPPWDRPGDLTDSVSAFLGRQPDQASDLWYWGATPSHPKVRGEFSPLFDDLRSHTDKAPFWGEYDGYRLSVGDLLQARIGLIAHIEDMMRTRVDLPICADDAVASDCLTSEFALSIYRMATVESTEVSGLDYRLAHDEDAGVHELRWGRHREKPLARFHTGSAKPWKQLVTVHMSLANDVMRSGLGYPLVSAYRRLAGQVPALRKSIDSSKTRAVIAETSCGSCAAPQDFN